MKKEDLRIVFFGTPEFAVEALDSIRSAGYRIEAAVTMPDKPAGRGHKLLFSPVKTYALEHGLKLLQPVNLKAEEFVEELRSLNANLFIVIAFRMLPQVVWSMPEQGTFNLHASLLPKYRGAAPINWALINGDTETGVTTFFLKHEIDTGDILRQERIEILPSDNAGDLHDRLMKLGAKVTLETIGQILSGELRPVPQDQFRGISPTPAPKIFKETCHIDWKRNALEIHNLVRGLSPYPAAWSFLQSSPGKECVQVKIFQTALVPKGSKDTIPGRLRIVSDRIFVDCGDGQLELLSVQIAGKKRMSVADFLRGAKLSDQALMS